jgi:hypothetical protein
MPKPMRKVIPYPVLILIEAGERKAQFLPSLIMTEAPAHLRRKSSDDDGLARFCYGR